MNLKALNFKIIIPVLLICTASLITLAGLIPQLDQLNYLASGNNYIFLIKQSIGMFVGFIFIILILLVNLKRASFLIDIGYWILFAMLVILVANIPGTSFMVENINGASGWFKIPIIGATIQPVEFMKIALFFKLALISKNHIESNDRDIDLFFKYLIYAGIPIFLVLLQPDLGGVILLAFPTYVMFLASLKSTKHLLTILFSTLGVGIIVLILLANPTSQAFIVEHTPLYSYQLSRINAWINPFSDPDGYQLQQSLILIGSAGLFGRGFGFSGISLPEPHTDVIFSEFVGMFGIIAGIILILLYAIIIYQVFNIGTRNKELQYRYLCLGYGTLLIVQVFENIGMMVGVFPITGIVLPFMSYGLSALITYSVIIGLVLKIDMDNP